MHSIHIWWRGDDVHNDDHDNDGHVVTLEVLEIRMPANMPTRQPGITRVTCYDLVARVLRTCMIMLLCGRPFAPTEMFRGSIRSTTRTAALSHCIGGGTASDDLPVSGIQLSAICELDLNRFCPNRQDLSFRVATACLRATS